MKKPPQYPSQTRYSEEDKERMLGKVDAYVARGYSKREACKQANVPYSAFTLWDRKRRGLEKPRRKPAKVPELQVTEVRGVGGVDGDLLCVVGPRKVIEELLRMKELLSRLGKSGVDWTRLG